MLRVWSFLARDPKLWVDVIAGPIPDLGFGTDNNSQPGNPARVAFLNQEF
jgi:hypothetical protein